MPAARVPATEAAPSIREEPAGSKEPLDAHARLAGIGGWEYDLQTGRLSWSAETCRIHGVAPGHQATLEQAIGFVAPEAQPELEAAFERSAVTGDGWDLELPLIQADGTRIWVRSIATMQFAEDAPPRLIGAVQDISAQVAQRHALEHANDRLKLATQSAEIGIWDIDLQTGDLVWDVFMYWLYGRTPDLGLSTYAMWQQHIHPDDWGATEAALRAAGRGIKAFNTGFRVIWLDGSVHHLRAAARVIRDAQGQPLKMVGVSWDVTEQMQLAAEREARVQELGALNEQLARLTDNLENARAAADRANLAKSRFLAAMSHELRTPLAGILGYAQLLQMDGGLSAVQAKRVQAMLEAGGHLLDMIGSVLGLSEIEEEHVVLRPVAVDLPAIAAGCLDQVRPRADAKGLTLQVDLPLRAPPRLVADPVRLRQILLNLLGNAVKFTDVGGVTLRVRADVSGPIASGVAASVRIEVADTGPGIPPEQRRRLFQSFERLQADAADNGGGKEGTGLGLALSARLAELMGGRLGYEPDPGGGSVFWLELPADHAPPLPAPDEAGRRPQSAAGLRVLVVDDVDMNRDIACAFLRAAGHYPTAAGSGPEALTTLTAEPFDVVLMDVCMPGMDGLEATRRIRALGGARSQVPIIGLTAQAFAEQVEACTQAGMNAHLCKPYAPEALAEAVLHAAREI
jgi:two-component system sensor histidine kinase/response regulator